LPYFNNIHNTSILQLFQVYNQVYIWGSHYIVQVVLIHGHEYKQNSPNNFSVRPIKTELSENTISKFGSKTNGWTRPRPSFPLNFIHHMNNKSIPDSDKIILCVVVDI